MNSDKLYLEMVEQWPRLDRQAKISVLRQLLLVVIEDPYEEKPPTLGISIVEKIDTEDVFK